MILTDKEAESLAADVCCSVFDMRAIEAAILAKLASAELPEPATPNESGSTQCIVRWLVETPHGWIGSYEKEAISDQLRQAYAQGAAAQLAEKPEAYGRRTGDGVVRYCMGPDDVFGYEREFTVPLYTRRQAND